MVADDLARGPQDDLALLVAIPLFVIGEAVAHRVTTRLLPLFVHSGLVAPKDQERFRRDAASRRPAARSLAGTC